MKDTRSIWLILLVTLAAAGQALAASPPEMINYQGVLRNAEDQPENGSFDMIFSLYDTDGGASCIGGNLLLTDRHLAAETGAVTVNGGLFNVEVGGGAISPGTASSLAQVFRDHGEVYVEIRIGSEILCPRVRVVSTAYALNADHAVHADQALGDFHIGATLLADNSDNQFRIDKVSPTGYSLIDIAPRPLDGTSIARVRFFSLTNTTGPKWVHIGRGDGSGVSDVQLGADGEDSFFNSGNVGIGTTTPDVRLDVEGDMSVSGDLHTGTLVLDYFNGGLTFPDGTEQKTAAATSLPPDTCFDNVSRFVVCGNGAVKDNLTGLFWLEDASCLGLNDWANASIAAAQVADGQCGLSDGSSPGDWRLPTVEEWQAIVDQAASNGCSAPYFPDVDGRGCCGTETCAFSGVQSGGYWSSTTVASVPDVAWSADLGSGRVRTIDETVNFRVWPVRVGP